MAIHKAQQRHRMPLSAIRTVSIAFDDVLESGEAFTGTPTVTPSATGITATGVAINTSTLSIDGVSTATGKALTVSVNPSVAGEYELAFSCGTDATPAQTLYGIAVITVIPD